MERLCMSVLVVLEFLGGTVSLLVAQTLYRVYKSVGESFLALTSTGMVILGVGFFLELVGNTLSLASVGGHWKRPASVELLLANRGVLLSSPLYIVAYTLYALSLYLEHVPIQRGPLLAVPLVLKVYVDNNIVSLAILLYAGYLVATRGKVKPIWILFIALLGAGHALLIIAGLRVSYLFMAWGLCLHAVAPIVLGAWLLLKGRRV